MGKRKILWGVLVLLLVALLGLLVWLAGRYEMARWQDRVDRDVHESSADIRAGLLRNIQSIQALTQPDANIESFAAGALRLLQERRELLRVERRLPTGALHEAGQTPYRVNLRVSGSDLHWGPDTEQACGLARRLSGPAYSPSFFVPQGDGVGLEVMTLCIPLVRDGRVTEYLVGIYSLQAILAEWVGPEVLRGQEVSFTEGDGTRLAINGRANRSLRSFSAQQLMDLPGSPMVLRIDSWRSAPDLFPNVLTALVAALSLAFLSVLALLARDMQKRQKAEKELAESFAFRKAMEDSLVTGLRARDLQGCITYVNPAFCEMVGFGAPELLGKSAPAPYWPPEHIEEYGHRQAIRLAGNAPPREGFESVFMRKDGERFPVLIFEAPLINAQGEQAGWMSAILDISEQRRMEEVSRASQERLQATARLATVGEMASLLSHELNQPLAAISSYATGSLNLLPPESPQNVDIREAVARIAEQADRAGRVIRSVHDFVRRRDEQRVRVGPGELLEAVRPLIDLQARKFGVQVRVRLGAGLPDCHCDRTMVEQVLLNLARNGIQAMQAVEPSWRKLDIDVRTNPGDHDWMLFSVADHGTGIDPEVATQLFTPFFTTKAEGMGLGLSMCRTVVEQHGGFLEYRSQVPRGTVFVFTLPTHARQSPLPPPGEDACPEGPAA